MKKNSKEILKKKSSTIEVQVADVAVPSHGHTKEGRKEGRKEKVITFFWKKTSELIRKEKETASEYRDCHCVMCAWVSKWGGRGGVFIKRILRRRQPQWLGDRCGTRRSHATSSFWPSFQPPLHPSGTAHPCTEPRPVSWKRIRGRWVDEERKVGTNKKQNYSSLFICCRMRSCFL